MSVSTTFLFIFNTIISILHPIKYIPQIIHTINTEKANDLSQLNIICEIGLNLMSLTSCILIYFSVGKKIYFLPIIIEKSSSTIFIIMIYILKQKYTIVHSYEESIPLNSQKIVCMNV